MFSCNFGLLKSTLKALDSFVANSIYNQLQKYCISFVAYNTEARKNYLDCCVGEDMFMVNVLLPGSTVLILGKSHPTLLGSLLMMLTFMTL